MLPHSGVRPTFTKRAENFALSEAMRMSQASGIVRPMPTAWPLIAAITGLPRPSAIGTSGLPSRLEQRRAAPAARPARRSPATSR